MKRTMTSFKRQLQARSRELVAQGKVPPPMLWQPGRCASRTPGWLLVRVPMQIDGRKVDAHEASARFADEPWASDVRYLGAARGWHCWERPGEGVR